MTSDITITTASAEAGSGDITIEALASIVNADLTNDRALSLHAERNIVMGAGSSISSTTTKLDVNSCKMRIQRRRCITLSPGATINTNGGNVLLAGGAGETYAVGNSMQQAGIALSGAGNSTLLVATSP
ncbi:MAG: hypothetical protein IPP41_13995 [Rhodocyclaceae bacterium]|nr:hypothetical protein [Rhodocyclaceae bacterium]